MLLLNNKLETTYVGYNDTVTFDFEWLWEAKVKVTQISRTYIL